MSMKSFRRTGLRATALCLSMAASAGLIACSELGTDRDARLNVSLQGLSGNMGTVELEVAPGDYVIEATGEATADGAEIRIVGSLAGQEGSTAFSARLDIPNADAGAQPGDRGHGEATVTAEPGVVTNITLPFSWDGARPDSGWNVEIEFGRSPDIHFWAVQPAPVVFTDEPLELTVAATNHSGPTQDLQFTVLFNDTPAASNWVFDDVQNFHVGQIDAPSTGGNYDLRLFVEDDIGGQTAASKVVTVVDASAELLLNASTDSVDVVITTTAGNKSKVTVTVTSGGSPVEGAEVLVYESSDNSNRQSGMTDSSGKDESLLGGQVENVTYHVQWTDANGQVHVVTGTKRAGQ